MVERVAFISEHASPLALLGGTDAGGQNVYIDRVAHELANTGIDVDIFTRWDDPGKARVIDYAPGIRVVHVKAGPRERLPKEKLFPFMDAFSANVAAFIRDSALHYDLVHAHFWMSGYVAMRLKEWLGVPFVVTFHALGKVRRVHQGDADGFPDARFRIEEAVASRADALVAECPQDREDLMILYFADPRKIEIIPCGFDSSEFHPMDKTECARRIGMNGKEKIILQLGRMVPRKGIDNVIRATAMIVEQAAFPVRLVIVGGESDTPDPGATPEIGRLLALSKSLGIHDKVTFTGSRNRDELKYFYNAAHLFVSTPWYEPFGITILEAMACGTPVVGANVGGIKYSVEHGRTGYLVPPHDPAILALRMKEILENPPLARSFGNAAITRVNARFTWKIVSRQIADLYEHVLRDHGQQTQVHHYRPPNELHWRSQDTRPVPPQGGRA